MAEKKNVNTAPEATEEKELDLEQKITIKSIAGWNVAFARLEGYGSVLLAPGGSTKLTRGEVIAQVQNGNKLFTGPRGDGDHPTIYIDDAPTRVELGFEEKKVYTEAAVKSLFDIKNMSAFEEHMKDLIYTRAEKYAIIQSIKKGNYNDFNKIRLIEDYTGFKVQ